MDLWIAHSPNHSEYLTRGLVQGYPNSLSPKSAVNSSQAIAYMALQNVGGFNPGLGLQNVAQNLSAFLDFSKRKTL